MAARRGEGRAGHLVPSVVTCKGCGGGGRNEGGGGSLMLADTDTQLELSETVSPLLRTIGLISRRLGISFAITGSGFDNGFSHQ